MLDFQWLARSMSLSKGENQPTCKQILRLVLMTSVVLYDLYWHFNHHEENWKIPEVASHKKSNIIEDWGGGQTCQLLQSAYTISFLCLLRFDEVLKIQAHDSEFMSETCIKHCHFVAIQKDCSEWRQVKFLKLDWGNSRIDNWTIILRHQAIFLAPALIDYFGLGAEYGEISGMLQE